MIHGQQNVKYYKLSITGSSTLHILRGKGIVPVARINLVSGIRIPGARAPWRLNFVEWRIIFVGAQYGICSMSLFWRLEIFRQVPDFAQFVHLRILSTGTK